ncbi:MAG: hypothetical protein AMXMBFR84_48560 [Candidatus Hydrogenedentota bacterium]
MDRLVKKWLQHMIAKAHVADNAVHQLCEESPPSRRHRPAPQLTVYRQLDVGAIVKHAQQHVDRRIADSINRHDSIPGCDRKEAKEAAASKCQAKAPQASQKGV